MINMTVLEDAQEMAKLKVMDIENIKYSSDREVLKIINGHQFTDADYLAIGKSVVESACHDLLSRNV